MINSEKVSDDIVDILCLIEEEHQDYALDKLLNIAKESFKNGYKAI